MWLLNPLITGLVLPASWINWPCTVLNKSLYFQTMPVQWNEDRLANNWTFFYLTGNDQVLAGTRGWNICPVMEIQFRNAFFPPLSVRRGYYCDWLWGKKTSPSPLCCRHPIGPEETSGMFLNCLNSTCIGRISQ